MDVSGLSGKLMIKTVLKRGRKWSLASNKRAKEQGFGLFVFFFFWRGECFVLMDVVFCFKTGSCYIPLTSLEFARQTRLALDFTAYL